MKLDVVLKNVGCTVTKMLDQNKHIIYHLLLNTKYKSSIYECNEILRTNKCKPLSKEE